MNEMNQIILALEKRISDADSTYEWDDLMSVRRKNPRCEAVRRLCWQVFDAFPPTDPKLFCSAGGRVVLKSILEALKAE